MAYFSSYYRLD